MRLALPLGITVTAVVQHLQILEESGLVYTEKTGRSLKMDWPTNRNGPPKRAVLPGPGYYCG